MKPVIGVVVPALAAGGGVPAVARFLCRRIEAEGRYRLRVFSVSTSSTDGNSQRLRVPRTWLRPPVSSWDRWDGRRYRHFGTHAAELEFLRYQPQRPLTRALRRCDLIQVVAGSPAHALLAREARRPVALQVATLVRAERARKIAGGPASLRLWRSLMTGVTARFDEQGLRAADIVLVENRWMFEHARRTVRGGSTEVCLAHPGVDSGWFVPDPDRSQRLRQDPYILFVGRLSDARKNVDLLADAYVRLSEAATKPPRLVLAGHGELTGTSRALLEQLRNPGRLEVVRAPSPDQLRRLYQNAACLALSSTEEGFGMVLIEAMACGVPAVATRCGGPEEIITDGADGYLVANGSAQNLALRLLELCTSPLLNQRMGAQARSTVEQRFSDEAAFQPFRGVYQRLLD